MFGKCQSTQKELGKNIADHYLRYYQRIAKWDFSSNASRLPFYNRNL